jgi:hypothetical protein
MLGIEPRRTECSATELHLQPLLCHLKIVEVAYKGMVTFSLRLSLSPLFPCLSLSPPRFNGIQFTLAVIICPESVEVLLSCEQQALASQVQCYTPRIPATREAEARRRRVSGQLAQLSSTVSQNKIVSNHCWIFFRLSYSFCTAILLRHPTLMPSAGQSSRSGCDLTPPPIPVDASSDPVVTYLGCIPFGKVWSGLTVLICSWLVMYDAEHFFMCFCGEVSQVFCEFFFFVYLCVCVCVTLGIELRVFSRQMLLSPQCSYC